MNPEIVQAEAAKQHDRAVADFLRLQADPETTVEIVYSPQLEHPHPHADVHALSVVTPESDRGFWMGTAPNDGAARLLAADLGLKVVTTADAR